MSIESRSGQLDEFLTYFGRHILADYLFQEVVHRKNSETPEEQIFNKFISGYRIELQGLELIEVRQRISDFIQNLLDEYHKYNKVYSFVASSGSIIERCGVNGLPEKVDSLEVLAQSALPVPENRFYLNSDCKDTLPAALYQHLREFFLRSAQSGSSIIVRSAHPDEHLFPGGAFDSMSFSVKQLIPSRQLLTFCKDHENRGLQQIILKAIWSKIMNIWAEITDNSSPERNLTVKRNVGDKNFDPSKMGIFINELCPSKVEVLASVLEGQDSLNIRFVIQNDTHVGIVNIDIDDNNVSQLTQALSRAGVSGFNPEQFIADLRKAKCLFSSSQEMEIHVGQNGKYTFVQSKSIEVDMEDERGQVEITDEDFASGVHGSFNNRANRFCEFGLMRADRRDYQKQLPVIVIDEMAWAIVSGWWTADKLDTFLHSHLSELMSPTIVDGHDIEYVKGTFSYMDYFLTRFKEAYDKAIELGQYVLVVRNLNFDPEQYLKALHPISKIQYPHAVEICRMMINLADNASAQVRAIDLQLNGNGEYEHRCLSLSGPKQFIIVNRGNLRSNHNDGSNIQRFMTLETGEVVQIMIRNGRPSILPVDLKVP